MKFSKKQRLLTTMGIRCFFWVLSNCSSSICKMMLSSSGRDKSKCLHRLLGTWNAREKISNIDRVKESIVNPAEAKTYLPKCARVGLYLCVITLFTAAKPTAHLLQKRHPDKSVYQQKVIETAVTFWCCVFLVFGVSVGFKNTHLSCLDQQFPTFLRDWLL